MEINAQQMRHKNDNALKILRQCVLNAAKH